MKALVAVVLLLLLVLALVMLAVWYITDSAAAIEGELAGLDELLATNDWPAAQALYDRSFIKWSSTLEIWQVLINHDDMRDIEVAFIDLGTAISQQDCFEAERELAGLVFYLKHVPDTERVDWGNIL